MTDTEYLKIMYSLGDELERVTSTEPYDQEAYGKVIEAINRTNRIWWRSRRRRHWGMICFCLFLIYCLAWIVWSILF